MDHIHRERERKHFIKNINKPSMWEGTLVRGSYDDLSYDTGPFNQGLADLRRPVAEGIVPQLFCAEGAQDDWKGRE